MIKFNSIEPNKGQFKQMAIYLAGLADGLQNEKLREAADMLKDASDSICAQGHYGCYGGEICTSDHK